MNVKPRTGTEKIVYFVRHGQSQANVSPEFQSESSPLSDEGHRQAEFIAERVASVNFSTLIASPLERTKQTAEHITRVTGKSPIYSDLFVERAKPSAVAGKPWNDDIARKVWREWERSLVTPGMKVEDGESYDEILARADEALAFLYAQPEQILTVVTHGYFLRTLVIRVLLGNQMTPEAFAQIHKVASVENTGVTVMTYEDSFEQEACWRLVVFNDHAHLAQ